MLGAPVGLSAALLCLPPHTAKAGVLHSGPAYSLPPPAVEACFYEASSGPGWGSALSANFLGVLALVLCSLATPVCTCSVFSPHPGFVQLQLITHVLSPSDEAMETWLLPQPLLILQTTSALSR